MSVSRMGHEARLNDRWKTCGHNLTSRNTTTGRKRLIIFRAMATLTPAARRAPRGRETDRQGRWRSPSLPTSPTRAGQQGVEQATADAEPAVRQGHPDLVDPEFGRLVRMDVVDRRLHPDDPAVVDGDALPRVGEE